jgi:hypothetical protein
MIAAFLSAQPLLTLFLVIAAGYAIGAISVRGFSLGVGAVLFTGLFIGAVAPAAQPPALVGTLGLVMFLYGLGVQFGAEFVAGLTSRSGRRYSGELWDQNATSKPAVKSPWNAGDTLKRMAQPTPPQMPEPPRSMTVM